MARYDYATPFVQSALRAGLGPTAGLRAAREAGLRIQDSRWFRAYGSERANIAMAHRFRDAPLNRRPSADEIGQWDTVRKRGYAYRVRALTADTVTGAEDIITVTVTSDSLISRQNAINQAMDKWADPEEKYPKQIQAAFVTGVYEMVPDDTE